MPRQRNQAGAGNVAATAETVAAALSGVSAPSGDPIDLEASVDLTAGTATTAVTLRLRRGVDATGTVVQTYGPFTVAAGNRVNLTINAVDVPSADVASQGYVVTVQQTAATGNGTVNGAYIGALY